jgi:hypothetical protein
MALTQQEIDQARNWISSQWGGDGSLPGLGSAFNGGVYDPSNTQRNFAVLGAGQAMGYDANAMSQILGQTAGDITAMGRQYQPQSNIYADIFRADNPGVAPQQGGNPMINDLSQHSTFTPNPYAGAMASDIQRRTNQGLQEGLAGIRSHFVGSGGLGGDRQGIAEGVAIRGAMDSLQGNLGNLYGGMFESNQNRGLQRYGIDTNARLTDQGQQLGFYSTQRAQDMDLARLGADLYNLGTTGQWTPIAQANNVYNDYTGLGTTTNSGRQGGGASGAIGGAIAGASMGRQMGWW